MARSLPLAAYLALRGADDPKRALPSLPARPDGVIVWVICANAQMRQKATILEQALTGEGDQLAFVRTTLHDPTDTTAPHPAGRKEVSHFIEHFKPSLVLVLDDHLDPLIINALRSVDIPVVLGEATSAVTKNTDRHWIPGLTRSILGLFDMIFAVDAAAAQSIIQAGARSDQIKTIGTIDAAAPVLPYSEGERQDFAATVGTRPVWLAAETSLQEVDVLARAHFQASRRAHRLLMIVALRDPEVCEAAADAFRSQGFDVAVRAKDQDVTEATQIYIVDGSDDLGLWYRAAPVTYLGETLHAVPQRHPYEAASLGTALVCGPKTAPYDAEIQILNQVGGCMIVKSADGLGDAIELLLSADKVAEIVHAAWDVTTRGADVVQKMATLILTRIDAQGHT